MGKEEAEKEEEGGGEMGKEKEMNKSTLELF